MDVAFIMHNAGAVMAVPLNIDIIITRIAKKR